MGNVLSAASIEFGGGTYTGFKSIADILKLQIMSTATFYRLQKTYVFPVVNVIYKKYRDSLLEQCKGRGFIDVSGDGSCDSPGYNAKFSTYSIMDELTSKILLFHIVTVAETGSSSSMEKLGLIKVLEKSDSLELDLGCITTEISL